jgi:hypothetical protein
MGVTFSFGEYVEDPTHGRILAHGVDCKHTCTQPEPCETAVVYFGACEHAEAAKAACGCKAFDVGVNQANAMELLRLLGYVRSDQEPRDYVLGVVPVFDEAIGEADPEAFLGRVLTAEALLGAVTDDQGTPAAATPGAPNYTGGGRRPGYFSAGLADLRALAEEAHRRGVLVAWS